MQRGPCFEGLVGDRWPGGRSRHLEARAGRAVTCVADRDFVQNKPAA